MGEKIGTCCSGQVITLCQVVKLFVKTLGPYISYEKVFDELLVLCDCIITCYWVDNWGAEVFDVYTFIVLVWGGGIASLMMLGL